MFKKRFDDKYPGILFMLLMTVCMSMSALSGEGKWAVNPSDFRYDMSLYFSVEPAKYADLEKYEIGAFVGEDCRGIAQKIDLPAGGNCLYMRIRSNVASGEEVKFFLLDRKSEQVLPINDGTENGFMFNADEMVGLPSQPFKLYLPKYTLAVEAGENGSVKVENGAYTWGSVVEIEAVPDEGYHFVAWSDGSTENPRQLTIESDVTLSAVFAVSSYSLTFEVDGEIYEMKTLNFGDKIELPVMAEREGYTFSGWGDAPDTMPARDLTLHSSYTVNIYKLKLVIDGEVYMEYDTPFGTPLNREDFENSTPPAREGYTFSGWGEVPQTMPSHDVELIGSYSVNSYLLTLILNGEVYEIRTVAYGEALDLPTPPEQEGQTWDGWDNAPETMPAHDLQLYGDYEFNGYKLTLMLDGEVYEMRTILFGDPIELPVMEEREGYTFSGWSEAPATMPARDVEVKGEYKLNSYKLTLLIDGEVYKEEEVPFGTELVIGLPDEREGFTFSGWGEVMKTMPAHDVVLSGTFTINSYTLTLMLDDTVYQVMNIEYGQKLEIEDAPEREGYTFTGWGEVPETMPAENITLTGEYTINFYKLTLYIDGVVYSESMLPFSHPVVLPEPDVPEGFEFKGWEGEIPLFMPAHDVDLYGSFIDVSGVGSVVAESDGIVTVSSLSGTILFMGSPSEAENIRLAPGIYVINGKKVMITGR